MYIYMYIYMSICVNIYLYIYIYIYMHIYTYTYTYICISTYINTCIYIQTLHSQLSQPLLLWCNNGIGGFHKSIVIFWGPKLPDLLARKMRLKKRNSLVQLKSWQVWTCGAKTQKGGKTPQNRPSQAQIISESKFSCIFQQPLNRDKYV